MGVSDAPRKVWLVWTGCYSDAQVEAVFDNEAAADELAEALKDDGGHVEEYEVGTRVPRLTRAWVNVSWDAGDVIATSGESFGRVWGSTCEPRIIRRGSRTAHSPAGSRPIPIYVVEAHGKDAEAALRNAMDFRASVKATRPDVVAKIESGELWRWQS